ncbi:deoxynucleoside kinase-like [Symsagittifera roscoffensis]|uniref:deoxynucleoside kinase-like n=1 Tax=Symsagittifera roscoffensis TaxID=84072 RepID=UPI00307B2172
MVFPHLLLCKTKSEIDGSLSKTIARRLKQWQDGDLDGLYNEGKALQMRLLKGSRRKIETEAQQFNKLMNTGKISSAIAKLTDTSKGVLSLDEIVKAGKSNLMGYIKEQIEKEYGISSVKLVPEPVNEWNDVAGSKLFDLMMQDPKRWSFAFQNYVQLLMFRAHHLNFDDSKVHLMERSLHSARYVFEENHKKLSNLTPMEFSILEEFYQTMNSELEAKSCTVDCFLYLETTPELCHQRLQHRLKSQDAEMTKEESRVTLQYLKSLHELHETEFLNRAEFKDKVIRVDASGTKEELQLSLGFEKK